MAAIGYFFAKFILRFRYGEWQANITALSLIACMFLSVFIQSFLNQNANYFLTKNSMPLLMGLDFSAAGITFFCMLYINKWQ